MKDDLALKTSEIHSLEIRLSAEPVKIGGEMDEKKISNSVSRMALTTSRDTPSIESEQTPIYQNENQSISEAPINQSQSAISSKIKIPYNQRIEQGLIQEAILFIQKGVLTSPINNLKTQESDVNIGNDKGGRELAQLFSDAEIAEGKMVEAKQKEIICWYTYREAYQNSVAEIQSKTGIAEKTAKTQVYIMIKASLPKVSDVNLYKKTQRAGTIYKLFGKIIDPITQKEVKGIGIDKAYGISYGAKSISELTNVQILNIIKQVTEKSHDILTNGQDRTKPFGSNDLAETKSFKDTLYQNESIFCHKLSLDVTSCLQVLVTELVTPV
ncbi:22274_t:CDS:2 [Entrophospora sp. SA101]|nr:22274_t:CDS:2 [Entrophospora sp. SA101]